MNNPNIEIMMIEDLIMTEIEKDIIDTTTQIVEVIEIEIEKTTDHLNIVEVEVEANHHMLQELVNLARS
jgi:hypothetical protein